MIQKISIVMVWVCLVLAYLPETPAQSQQAIGDAERKTNSLGMEFVLIPPGEFLMGSSHSAESQSAFFKENYQMGLMTPSQFENEQPQHPVRITKAFYFGIYPVTRGQFRKFVEDTGYKTVVERDKGFVPGVFGFDTSKNSYGFIKEGSWLNPGFQQADDHPVVTLAWVDAIAFCEWLSRKEGKSYRLPTEAEWEYTCRAGTTTRYHCGDDPELLFGVANIADATAAKNFERFAWTLKSSDGSLFTSPVGRFEPNAFGLYDMHGNVWQWCSDWYKPDYYAESPVEDPTGPGLGYRNRLWRVARGGSWYGRPWECMSSSRHWIGPDSRDCYQTGFRVVECVDPSDDPVKRAAIRSLPVADGVQVSIKTISNKRIGERHSLHIQWAVTGELMAQTIALRTLVGEARDAEGNIIPVPDSEDRFKSVDRNESYLNLQGPTISLKSLSGEIHLMVPSKDPKTVLTVDLWNSTGGEIQSSALQASGAAIAIEELRPPSTEDDSRKQWSCTYIVKDPYGKIIGNPQFVDAQGQTIPTRGPFGGGSGGSVSMTVVFENEPPRGVQATFLIATDQSLMAVPFEFQDVPVSP